MGVHIYFCSRPFGVGGWVRCCLFGKNVRKNGWPLTLTEKIPVWQCRWVGETQCGHGYTWAITEAKQILIQSRVHGTVIHVGTVCSKAHPSGSCWPPDRVHVRLIFTTWNEIMVGIWKILLNCYVIQLQELASILSNSSSCIEFSCRKEHPLNDLSLLHQLT